MREQERRRGGGGREPHQRCSFVRFVSPPSAPTTAVPPSFPRAFLLRQAKVQDEEPESGDAERCFVCAGGCSGAPSPVLIGV